MSIKASISDQNNLIELKRIDSAIMQASYKLKTLPEREQLTAIHARLAASAELLTAAEAELADVTIEECASFCLQCIAESYTT